MIKNRYWSEKMEIKTLMIISLLITTSILSIIFSKKRYCWLFIFNEYDSSQTFENINHQSLFSDNTNFLEKIFQKFIFTWNPSFNIAR